MTKVHTPNLTGGKKTQQHKLYFTAAKPEDQSKLQLLLKLQDMFCKTHCLLFIILRFETALKCGLFLFRRKNDK